jgi:hypothetical protein
MSDISFDLSHLLLAVDENARNIISSLRDAQTTQRHELQAHFDLLTSKQRLDYENSRLAFIQDDAENRKISVQSHILQTLNFAEMSQRVDALTPAHYETFKWLYQNSQNTEIRWDSFQDWLSYGSGVYWVHGKAGSGKSTLLRYIWEQHKTWDYLENWTEGSQIIAGAFYFWNSGVAEQRSHSGFLRSLLYEVLKKRSDLIATIFPDEWKQNCSLSSRDAKLESIDWSLGQLRAALQRLARLATKDFRICFFIDGLDEYDGDAGDIAEYVLSVAATSPYIKICVSSRPWPVFEDVFCASPRLRLQDLTKDDIRAFVNDKLGRNKNIHDLRQCDPENTDKLVEDVVSRADGVFLWVQLVIKTLVEGLRDGDEISHLRSRLARLPFDLSNLYEHMLHRIESEYREDSAKIFQIFRANNYSLGLATLERALTSPARPLVARATLDTTFFSSQPPDKHSKLRMRRMALRLNSRTMGLLEIHEEQVVAESSERDLYQPTATCVIRKFGQSEHASYRFLKERSLIKVPSWRAIPFTIPSIQNRSDTAVDPEPAPNLDRSKPNDSINIYVQEQPLEVNPKIRQESWPQKSPYIAFIHRTARDYLEQDHVWERIIRPTFSVGFDPYISLLSGFVREARTTSLIPELGNSWYEVGSQMFYWLGKLSIPEGSPAADALLTDLDELLTYECPQIFDSARRPEWLDAASSEIVSAESFFDLTLQTERDVRDSYLLDLTSPSVDPTPGTSFDPEQNHGIEPDIDLCLPSNATSRIEARSNDKLLEFTPHTTHNVMSSADFGTLELDAVSHLDLDPDFDTSELDAASHFDLDRWERLATTSCEYRGCRRSGLDWYGHWSAGAGVELGSTAKVFAKGGHDILSAAVAFGVRWFYTNKLENAAEASSCHQDTSLRSCYTRDEVPLLAYALRFDESATAGAALEPNVDTLRALLQHNHDPNAMFQGVSVWEYTIHTIHMARSTNDRRPDLAVWVQVLKLMLQHGADPHAYCIGRCGASAAADGLQQNGDMVDASKYVANHTQRHSVDQVVHDVFAGDAVPGLDALFTLLHKKKSEPLSESQRQAKIRRDEALVAQLHGEMEQWLPRG